MGKCFAWFLIMAPVVLVAQDFDVTKISSVYQPSGMERVKVVSETFKKADDVELRVDIYYPPETDSKTAQPVVVFNNGVGAMSIPDWRIYGDWARLAAVHGLIGINYQSRRGQAMEDGEDLLAFLRERGASLGIDADRVGIWTCSGNVTVGLPLMMAPERDFIRCAVIYYGMPDTLPEPRSDLPILLVRAGLDTFSLNRNIGRFIHQAVERDLPLELINFVDGHHAFDAVDDTEQSREIIRRTLDFLKQNLSRDLSRPAALTSIGMYSMLERGQTEAALNALAEAAGVADKGALKTPFHGRIPSLFNLDETARALIRAEEWESANALITETLKLFPNSPVSLQTRAEWNLEQGRIGEAIASGREALAALKDAEMRDSWRDYLQKQIAGFLQDLGQDAAEGGREASSFPANAAGITLDGTLDAAEWGEFDEESVARGGLVKFRQDKDHLIIGIKSNLRSVGHVYLFDGERIQVLHASASLGKAVYAKEGRMWKRQSDFEWAVRDPRIRERLNISTDHGEEQQAYLAEQGWLVNTMMMGEESEIEIMLSKKILGEGTRLALGFHHRDARGRQNIVHFPSGANVAPPAYEEPLFYGSAPETASFRTKNWLEVSQLIGAPGD